MFFKWVELRKAFLALGDLEGCMRYAQETGKERKKRKTGRKHPGIYEPL
jgi:hypothetical protein